MANLVEIPKDFKAELENLINKHSRENCSNTPDFLLADYMMGCLVAFENAVVAREKWYGRERKESPAELKQEFESNPITYRMLHEAAAGVGLRAEFYTSRGINPHAPVICNCNFDAGHEPSCDLVFANDLRTKINASPSRTPRAALDSTTPDTPEKPE